MDLTFELERPHLKIGQKKLSGIDNSERKGYFGCRFVFEPSNEEFSFYEILGTYGTDFVDSVCISAGYKSDIYEYVFNIMVGRINDKLNLSITSDYMLGDWNEHINLKFFLSRFELELKNSGIYNVDADFDFSDGGNFISLEFSIDLNSTLQKPIDEACYYMANTHTLVSASFSEDDSFISQFRFPPEHQYSFVQYLTYFGKFLEDLGIQGDLSLRNRDGLTYLSFYPIDKDVALENIAAALSSYLSLPENNNISFIEHNSSLESEIRFQQLASVVDHLKSQLRLSNAVISLKEKEISLLESHTALNLKEEAHLSSNIKDYWEPIEGIKITSYKGKFFEINIPKIIGNVTGSIGKQNK
ncbi:MULTISPECIES: hypothetical protein [Methylomonas]|uniref:Uncharacterized protein n=2 Tax=Methylomonas TaxID=416 RepID=A0A140E643_9GAMM|nr:MULTISPECIES: hypothetical protein [Methylomonas]AMK78867.1 hypothetical protein JT25_020665 [Methylomonas denitrificans]OAI02140.1 hypothetical protein A1342_02595 [Methylomonas methanica]TCV78269.1 hypothetical protein EDE11_12444 [Methylomonas methanica]